MQTTRYAYLGSYWREISRFNLLSRSVYKEGIAKTDFNLHPIVKNSSEIDYFKFYFYFFLIFKGSQDNSYTIERNDLDDHRCATLPTDNKHRKVNCFKKWLEIQYKEFNLLFVKKKKSCFGLAFDDAAERTKSRVNFCFIDNSSMSLKISSNC